MGLAVVSFSRKEDRIWKMNKYEKFMYIAYEKKEVLILLFYTLRGPRSQLIFNNLLVCFQPCHFKHCYIVETAFAKPVYAVWFIEYFGQSSKWSKNSQDQAKFWKVNKASVKNLAK